MAPDPYRLPDPDAVRSYDEDAPPPSETVTATFGLGCFWGPDAAFGALDGVVRTRVGYAGGSTPSPTYHDLGDHTEVVQVDYDPERTTYRDLCAVAFRRHRPDRQPVKTQYENVLLIQTDDQRAALRAELDARGLDPEGIATRVERLESFHLAEPYHQKHHLRQRRLAGPLERAGYDDTAIRESPAAAVLNAAAGGQEVTATGLWQERPAEER